jgi:hypothetical protein
MSSAAPETEKQKGSFAVLWRFLPMLWPKQDTELRLRVVATMPTRYESRGACAAATGPALADNSDFDFPTLLAECRPAKAPAAERKPPVRATADTRRG